MADLINGVHLVVFVDHSKTNRCPLKTTTFLYCSIAPCFGSFRPSSGFQYDIARRTNVLCGTMQFYKINYGIKLHIIVKNW